MNQQPSQRNVVYGVPVGGEGKVEKGFPPQSGSSVPPVADGIPLYHDNTTAELRKFTIQGYQDVWAAVLWVAMVLMTFIWAIVNASTMKDVAPSPGQDFITHTPAPVNIGDEPTLKPQNNNNNNNEIEMWPAGKVLSTTFGLMVVAGVSCCISLAFLCKWPRQSIIGANVACGVFYLVIAIVTFSQGGVWPGLVLLFIGAMQLLWLYLVRDRIPFAALLLRLSTRLVQRYKAMVLLSFAGVVFFWIFCIFFTFMVLPVTQRASEQRTSTGDGFLIVLFLLVFFWVSQVVVNVMHVTASGVVATWYYVGDQMPPNPTIASFKRATTTSFGSICFGSLLVAIIKVMRTLAEWNRDHENGFVACCMVCIIRMLERLMEYFNQYAFAHVAIYGCSYVEAAKRTFALAKHSLFAAIFNDCLIGPTLGLIALCMAFAVGVVAWFVADPITGVLGFIITLGVQLIMLRSVESAVVTIFVCYADAPNALAQSSPELYNMLGAANVGVNQV